MTRLSEYTDALAHERRTRPLIRAATALAIGASDRFAKVEDIVRNRFGGDEAIQTIVRGAVSPSSLTGTTNAFAHTLVAFIESLSGAASGLWKRGMQLSFDRYGVILVPTMAANSTTADFVEEGAPIPVKDLVTSGATMVPKSIKIICVLSREVVEGSNSEQFVRDALARSAELALDAAMLSTAPADAVRPAGLLSYSAATNPDNETPLSEAMFKDVSELAAAVAPVAGDGAICIIASPAQAIRLKLANLKGVEILSSSALDAGTVVAVAANALVFACDPAPRITASREGTLHLDTTPLAIGTTGVPNTVAAPVRSLYQTDCVAIRLTFQCFWGARASNAVAWRQNCTW